MEKWQPKDISGSTWEESMIKLQNLVGPSPEQWMIVIRGMRNPMNSWDKMDSFIDEYGRNGREFVLGERDLDLARRLFVNGSEHRKYARMLPIILEADAPLFWYKEYDTYKIGTVANSCSTMHKLHSRPLTLEDFSTSRLTADSVAVLKHTIDTINDARKQYVKTKSIDNWGQMIELLPSSYNQFRTLSFNYETAVTMVKQRTGHKLEEWNVFVQYLLDNVPYLKEIANV